MATNSAEATSVRELSLVRLYCKDKSEFYKIDHLLVNSNIRIAAEFAAQVEIIGWMMYNPIEVIWLNEVILLLVH